MLGVLGKNQLQKYSCLLCEALVTDPPNLTHITHCCAFQPGMYDQEQPQLLGEPGVVGVCELPPVSSCHLSLGMQDYRAVEQWGLQPSMAEALGQPLGSGLLAGNSSVYNHTKSRHADYSMEQRK